MDRQANLCLLPAVLLAGLLVSLCLCGCGGGSGGSSPVMVEPEPLTMTSFADNTELENYLKDQYATNLISTEVYNENASFNSPPALPGAGGMGGPGGSGHSAPNVQEAGVDESDKVRTDGTYLFVVCEESVRIVEALPHTAMNVVSTVNAPGNVDSIYLYGDLLVVICAPAGFEGIPWPGTLLTGIPSVGCPYWIPVNARTGVLFVDVTDRENPQVLREFALDGWLVSSRLTGGRLHLVQQFLPELPPLKLYYNGSEGDRLATIAQNRASLQSISGQELMPCYEEWDSQGLPVANGPLVAAEDYLFPSWSAGGSLATVTTFDLDNLSAPHQSLGIAGDVHEIYASTQAVYLTARKYIAGTPYAGHTHYHYHTLVHKLDISQDRVRWESSGRTWGRILNQFSLGEHQQVLRLATSTGNTWKGTQSNNIVCLESQGEQLVKIGGLTGLAPGETIYAARFIEDRGYLVTFVQIDPLFTIDLADPTVPKVLGELKVPGYSDYIHPLGDHHLLTIGKDTLIHEGFVWYQGIQLSLFDIQVPADPTLQYSEKIGDRGTESEACHNHKAFTYWADHNLLAIPVELCEYPTPPSDPSQFGAVVFKGLMVYRVTPAIGFEYLGRVDTGISDLGWTRGLFIEDSVFAVQPDAVQAAWWYDIDAGVSDLPL